MTDLLVGDEFAGLFQTFTDYAFRYECQAVYNEPYEAEPWRKFRDGEHDDLEWMRPWLDGVRAATAGGKRFQRVRVLPDPLTDYLEWEMHIGHVNAEFGEDIRVMSEQDRITHRLPDHDFWLFDDNTVALMRYDDNHTFLGAQIAVDEDTVREARAWMSSAWTSSTPFEQDPRFQRA